MPLLRAAPVTLLPEGALVRLDLGGKAICLAHVPGQGFYAIEDRCPHEEASLSEGELCGCEIECPLHYSRFDLRTGEALSLPATEPASVFLVSVEDDEIYVDVPNLE